MFLIFKTGSRFIQDAKRVIGFSAFFEKAPCLSPPSQLDKYTHCDRQVIVLLSSNMDKSVAQALTGLIPSLSGPLPQELVELAVSLLAQSRNKASSLKAEEEIARSYACAHIACERLVFQSTKSDTYV